MPVPYRKHFESLERGTRHRARKECATILSSTASSPRQPQYVVQWGTGIGARPFDFLQNIGTIPRRGGGCNFCRIKTNNYLCPRPASVCYPSGGIDRGTPMLALKRLLLVILVLVIPAGLTVLLYWGTGALLAATNRVIDPEIVRLAATVEFAAFFFVAVLEAKDRWSSQS